MSDKLTPQHKRMAMGAPVSGQALKKGGSVKGVPFKNVTRKPTGPVVKGKR